MKRDYKRPDNWDSFVIYKSFYEPIKDLNNEQLGRLFRHLFKWQISGQTEPEKDVIMAFRFIVNQFRIDDNKRLAICHTNQENGKLGGRPPKTERLRKNRTVTKKPNGGHNDNVNENENEKENAKVVNRELKIPFNDPVFVDTWNELKIQPKWKHKSIHALQMALNQLSVYPVRFAVHLMQNAIAGNYQGVVFDNTPERYNRWLQTSPGAGQDPQPGEVVTDISNIYR